MVLDIGTYESSVKLDEVGERILGVINAVERNKIFVVHGGINPLDIDNINEIKKIECVPLGCWRVIALGGYWMEASTANEDPIVEFGRVGDPDAYGKMTSAITGGEKFNIADFQKLDPLDILSAEVIAETSATLATTWTTGAEFNVWNCKCEDLEVAEAAVAGMSSGKIKPFMVIEVKTRGKW